MENDYLTQLKNHLIKIIKNHPSELKDIIKQLDGAFPSDITNILKALEFDYPEIKKLLREGAVELKKVRVSKTVRITWIEESLARLSKAHPADYDWRFTADTADRLSEFICNKYSPKTVGLFGVTTLHIVLSHFNPEVDIYLVNKSSSLINDLIKLGYSRHLIIHDLFMPLPMALKFDLIVADPPWYIDFYKAFILRASQNLKLNGYMMLSVLPKLTRPKAEQDVKIINDFCELCGLKMIDIKNKFLIYETPEFERKSLHENAIDIADWRYGDLVIYEKITEAASQITLEVNDTDPQWLEFELNGKKIKISQIDDQNQIFSFNYVADHKVLPSVSRRYEKRNKINFWTSDNIAFNVTNLAVLKSFFANIANGGTVEDSLKRTTIEFDLKEDDLNTLAQLLRDAELL